MTNTVTISLSLGSGPKAQALALRIREAAGSRPVSWFIRNIIEAYLNGVEAGQQKEIA